MTVSHALAGGRHPPFVQRRRGTDWRHIEGSGHLLVYVLVNAFFVVIWAMTDPDGFFWPVFPIVGWGIGGVLNAWDVYRNDEFDEQKIRREIERLQAHAAGIR